MGMTRYRKQKAFSQTTARRNGYILVITVVLLAALLIMSLKFFERSADSLQISGYNREATESLVVAESTMNMLYGWFLYNKDIDGDGTIDREEKIDVDELNDLPFEYLYYVSSSNEVEQAFPSILQRIANGEARNEGGQVNSQIVLASSNRLLIDNLYSGSQQPIVFEFDTNNRLVQSNRLWSEIDNNNTLDGAVAWFELVQNDALLGNYQVYVQAVGKIGHSKGYVQRLILNLKTTLGRDVATLGEASL